MSTLAATACPPVAVLEREARARIAVAQAAERSGAPLVVVASPARLRAELAWFGAQAAALDFPSGAERTTMEIVRALSIEGVPVVVWTPNARAAMSQLGLRAPVISRSGDPDADLAELLDEVRRLVETRAPRPRRGSARWR